MTDLAAAMRRDGVTRDMARRILAGEDVHLEGGCASGVTWWGSDDGRVVRDGCAVSEYFDAVTGALLNTYPDNWTEA